jgi:hypothetical protein
MGVRLGLPHLEGGGENNRPRVFDSRVLRKIFGPKKAKVRGEWRRLHYQELYDLFSSTNTIRIMKSRRRVGHVARMGGQKRYIQSFVGSPDCKSQLGSPRPRWKIKLKGISKT